MKTLSTLALAFASLVVLSCGSGPPGRNEYPETPLQIDAQFVLDTYTPRWQQLSAAAAEAEWASNTRIVEGDDTNAKETRRTAEELAEFVGKEEHIQEARRFLGRRMELTPKQERQFEAILYAAAARPGSEPELVRSLIEVETMQNEDLFGYTFMIDGEEISPNEIDERLREETEVAERRKVWEASKGVGPTLREGLGRLRDLRNRTVRALGYDDFFSYKVSSYGMTTEEMLDQLETINRELRPLFRELHTWARYELAARYDEPVPDLIPAHWLPNRWGQDWSALVDVEGFDLDTALEEKEPEWLVRQAERFYISLGFEPLPSTFWEKSSLYPAPEDAGYKKNNHASAWHMDLERDVRCLMSVVPTTEWYETTHHELGHIYYYLAYTNPDVPPLLREGANRAYHEAVGSLMGLAAMQPRFVEAIGLEVGDQRPDPMQVLLQEALNYVVFIPWSTGTMTFFEKELYADELPASQWNQRWWDMKARFQGIAPPVERGEQYCDAATKTHINNDPAEYYDYALSFVLLFQLHDHIAKKILKEDPNDTNYYGRKDVGRFLRSILRPGASVDWRELLEEKTGSELSAEAMVEYFQPLLEWLQKENEGRTATLADL